MEHVGDDGPKRYLSCYHLQRGLVFYPGKVHACCANPISGRTPVIAEFTGGDLSIEAVIAGRKRITDQHKAGVIVPECEGCPRLTEDTWGEDDLRYGLEPINEVTIAHFTTCNIRCNYCYTVRSEADAIAPLSKVPRLLGTFEKLAARGDLAPFSTVRFSGGEPTLLPEFEALLTLLTDHGARAIVYTNATRCSPAILRALARDKVELILGIDAATRETYRAIKKMDYNEAVWGNVAEYAKALMPGSRNKVWAKFIFTRENYNEARQFVSRAVEAGVRHVYYDFDSYSTIGVIRGFHSNGLPEEICDRLAELRYDCAVNGIEAAFAQSGMGWLTPERLARTEAALSRLQLEGRPGERFAPAATNSAAQTR